MPRDEEDRYKYTIEGKLEDLEQRVQRIESTIKYYTNAKWPDLVKRVEALENKKRE